MARRKTRRPRLAVYKFASCDGCQLALLDCEDELLALSDAIEIAYFPEATRKVLKGPYDLALVEGSITTEHDRQRILAVRASCRTLVTLGACASAGGLQALRNTRDVGAFAAQVYPHPEYLSTLVRSTPIAEHVKVDAELRGCPIDKGQLLQALAVLLRGGKPALPNGSVCAECKRAGVVCLLVARGVACLGPVTQAGCGALCPRFARGCFGCFGPQDSASVAALARAWERAGLGSPRHALEGINAAAPGFAPPGGAHAV